MKKTIYLSMAACLLTSLLFVPILSIKAQSSNWTKSITLPEVSSSADPISYDVSEYSGSLNIKIPLFSIESGNVKIPVELCYDASGIKVEQDASFVGLGWNLSYGGSIKHIICGKDDFKEYVQNEPSFFKNFYSKKSIPNGDFTFYESYFKSRGLAFVGGPKPILYDPDNMPELKLYKDMANGCYLPDLFQASFCGKSVSFIIDKRDDSKIIILDDNSEEYKIEYEKGNRYPYYPSVFKITDKNGISYQFKAFREFDDEDSYYLTNVSAKRKSLITYEYSNFTYDISKSRPVLNNINHIGKFIEGNCSNNLFLTLYNSILGTHTDCVSLACGRDRNGLCDKVYPSKITTKTATIEFCMQARNDLIGDSALSEILVKKNGSIQNKICFSFGKFVEQPSSSYTKQRLKLESVMVDSKTYKMTYDTSSLPAFNSYSKDYWGYYNGTNNTSLCGTPRYIANNNVVKEVEFLGEANRYASENPCKVGILKKITYPKGYTDFEFEVKHFDDKYYYPDASATSGPRQISAVIDVSGAYGSKKQSKSFSFQKDTKCQFRVNLSTTASTNDISSVILKNISTGNIVKEITVSNGKTFGNSYDLTLAKGNYIMEASVTANRNSYSTVANCQLLYEERSTPTLQSGDEKGGVSMGGGLRVKSIKNYVSVSTGNRGTLKSTQKEYEFQNGIEYEYKEGKLLSPTVRLDKYHINFSHFYSYSYDQDPMYVDSTRTYIEDFSNFYYSYASSEPSYLAICLSGVPTTVGYSCVIKKEIDKNGQVIKKTKLDFHNYGYIMEDQISQKISIPIYYCPNRHLDGKLEKETVYSQNNRMLYSADYLYNSTRQISVLYPKCVPTYIPSIYDNCHNIGYDVVLFRKNVYKVDASKSETYYDNNGNKTVKKELDLLGRSSIVQQSPNTIHYEIEAREGFVNIAYDIDENATIIAIITNQNGVVYKEKKWTEKAGKGYSTQIDCNGLQPGIYILNMNINGTVYSKKIRL